MRIAINGIGIAGPTLAWWLKHYGHEAVLFEKSPSLRTGGYIIDFWGIGYDVAEKMGLLPELHQRGYDVQELRIVNSKGKKTAGVNVGTFRALTDNRFVSIARNDVATAIFNACSDVETRFGTSIVGLDQSASNVAVQLSDGTTDNFDLVIGADGLHSKVRELSFGPKNQFEHQLGIYVAAFELKGYQPRDELTYVTYTTPMRQVGRIATNDDRTVLLFIFSDSFVETDPENLDDEKQILRSVFADSKWEVPEMLRHLDGVDDIYFDRVSQIRMKHWTSGRVGLLGDAAACVSLLGGEGTGLAMTEAYVLAGEFHRAKGDYQQAFRNYESRLQEFLSGKQKSAVRMSGFFVPRNRLSLGLRDLGTNLMSIPFLARLTLRRAFRDNIDLPDYESISKTTS